MQGLKSLDTANRFQHVLQDMGQYLKLDVLEYDDYYCHRCCFYYCYYYYTTTITTTSSTNTATTDTTVLKQPTVKSEFLNFTYADQYKVL